MRTLWILPLLVAASLPAPAYADDTFEAKAAGAEWLAHVDSLVWALTASCDAGDDTQQRQCRHVRDARAAQLAGATLLVDADPDAFTVGAWSAAKKSLPLRLTGCIRCTGVELGGTTYYVVAGARGTAQAHVTGGKVAAGRVYDKARVFPDENAAKAFTQAAGKARVQMLVKVPAKPKRVIGGKPVIGLELVGYRVFSPCDGSIVVADPASGPAPADKKQCASKQAK